MDFALNPENIADVIAGTEAEDKLSEIKHWLFSENIRLQNLRQELEDQRREFDDEKDRVKLQMKHEARRLDYRKKQCAIEEKLIEEKWKALKRGFDELDEDRRSLKRMEKRIIEERRRLESDLRRVGSETMRELGQMTVFFRGVNDPLSLKKRYRDLLKIFHPDNIAGDKETVVSINKEYDTLKHNLEEF